jgi:hypothetical protein
MPAPSYFNSREGHVVTVGAVPPSHLPPMNEWGDTRWLSPTLHAYWVCPSPPLVLGMLCFRPCMGRLRTTALMLMARRAIRHRSSDLETILGTLTALTAEIAAQRKDTAASLEATKISLTTKIDELSDEVKVVSSRVDYINRHRERERERARFGSVFMESYRVTTLASTGKDTDSSISSIQRLGHRALGRRCSRSVRRSS